MTATDRLPQVAARPVWQRTLSAAGLGACICCAAVQAQLSFQLGGRIAPSAASMAEARGGDAARESPLPAVAELHLFGVYREAAPPVVPPPVVIRETPPGLRLQGVFTSSESADASALIAIEGSAAARRFQPGDQLLPELELVSVAMDHVLLRKADELQRLSLYRAEGRAGSVARVASEARRPLRWVRRTQSAARTLSAPEPERAAVVMARLRRLRAGQG